MTITDTLHDDLDEVRFEALCEAIVDLCRGHRLATVRFALAAMLAETYAQLPIADRNSELGYDLAIIRQYVRELPP